MASSGASSLPCWTSLKHCKSHHRKNQRLSRFSHMHLRTLCQVELEIENSSFWRGSQTSLSSKGKRIYMIYMYKTCHFLKMFCPIIWSPILHVLTDHIRAHMHLCLNHGWLPNLIDKFETSLVVLWDKLTSKTSDFLRWVTCLFTD